MERKKLRVDGIPTNIPAGRAKDKLTIHFLRSRNGGGEVENIDIIHGSPPYAVVTFEEDEVAERILRIKDHILKINDKTYNLVLSEVIGKLELDEVFQQLSLTVNYKRFPENRRNVLKNLRKTHKYVKFSFDEKSKTCDISGTYTDIQTLVQEILSKLEFDNESLNLDSSDMQKRAKSDQSIPHHSDLQSISKVGDQTSVPLYASADQTSYIPKDETIGQLEDQLVWDSDIFKYIQNFHSLEYQEILSKYHVQAVEESSDGITTLCIQPINGGKNKLAKLRGAWFDLLMLYQGLELILRKEQIDKRDINGDRNFQKTLLRELHRLYPMLLCHEDDQYLFLIGNGVDVAQGKQHISDTQSKFDKSSTFLDTYYGTLPAGNQERPGLLTSIPKSYKPDRYESKVGNRIAATFNSPTSHSSYSARTHLDEKYLSSSSSNNRQLQDLERYQNSDKIAETFPEYTAASYLKNEDFSPSQADEKFESKSIAPFKKQDVLPALKTGREDIRQSRDSTKSIGPLKPVRYTKASSDLPYSSLVDVGPRSLDFKIPEGKLRRSNSLSRISSRENTSSVGQGDTYPFRDEILMEGWLWYYIKLLHKSDIDILCTEVLLMEEPCNGNIILKLKATSKTKLTMVKEKIQLLCWKEGAKVQSSSFKYSTLGITGPDDSAVHQWCNLFCNCSKNLFIKLEKDELLLIYPKGMKEKVLRECSQHVENKIQSHSNLPLLLADDSQPSLHLKTVEQRIEPDFSGDNTAENDITPLKNKYFSEDKFFSNPQPEPLSSDLGRQNVISETNQYQDMKGLEDQKSSLFDGTNILSRITRETKAFFNNEAPSFQDGHIPTSSQAKELQDYLKGNNFFEEPDYCKLKSSIFEKSQTNFYTTRNCVQDVKAEVKTHDHGSYNAELLEEKINSPSQDVKNKTYFQTDNGKDSTLQEVHFPQFQGNPSELRSPAVGQESEKNDIVCDVCKNSNKAVKVSSGHYLCDNCHSTTVASCLDSTTSNDNVTLGATMTHTSMSLSLAGYERDTTLKIIYEVPDGVQRAEDPNPGQRYKGGRFEAYLPDNREGKKLIFLLEKALTKGLIFYIRTFETGDKVTWYKIPHKTCPDGGKQKNGYPDSSYIKYTIGLLKEFNIE